LFVKKINGMMFYNSAMAASQYVKKHYEGNKAYYIGKQGMKDEIKDRAFE